MSVGSGLFAEILRGSVDVIVIDRSLSHVAADSTVPVIPVEATEESKTLGGCEELVLAMNAAGVRRGDRVLAVGGGVIQDVATFVTDIYMRGLSWIYAPTTLMSMADSCIGGKSSINVGMVKNLVGGFHPPSEIVIDSTFLATLPPPAISAGLAEAAKIAFCRGCGTYEEYLRLHAIFANDPVPLLLHVLTAKKWFIEVDEHDQRERRLLNFGHTFGHAIEAAVDHRLSHGIAVAIGMLCAIAHPASAAGTHVHALEAHCRELLRPVVDLPEVLSNFDAARFQHAFRSDKKHSSSEFRLILPAPGEGVHEVALPNDDRAWDDVSTVVANTLHSLRGARG